MHIRRNIFLLAIFFLSTETSYSQENHCHNDSLLLAKCSFAIDQLIEKEHIYMFNSTFLDSLLSADQSTCNLILWANIFDSFFKRGLKINERLPKPQSRNNRFIIGEERNINESNPYEIYNIFKLFADFKIHFERQYKTAETSEYVKTIKELVKYGRYSFPTIVKNILLQKYPDVNKDKFNRDMRYHSDRN